ncbi:hypothetical protein TSACC_21697 [Terrimicrobium sacchariphilum]|uniref:Terminase n=1 Tax=Terrimicrobium sacchariphilum TaxID=690879 RepID=A0A146G8S1_TERSA|nr:hypothetical protein [Terrimicrobium sacchariphilum]GAT33284.1 hypothetical protein TSACC_21697 [Terrimicrobium sacchariphilum]
MIENLKDKLWRLQNLYSIKDAETGQVRKFVPRPEQMEIFRALLAGHRKIIILKARRLGMSTAIDVFAADEAIFNAGRQISIVDQNQDDASKKLQNIVKVAYSSLPAAIRERIVVTRDNDGSWQVQSKAGDASSAIYAGKNARGGTNQLLHISEWGVIQADDPKRSEEILTGALPSAEHGVTIIETTWKGGRKGHLWNLVKQAQSIQEEQRTLGDWRVFFFPWFNDPTYAASGPAVTDSELLKYFAEKEAETGHTFTPAQRLWYQQRRNTLGAFMYREFPTTFDECFRAPIDGAIYAGLIDKARAEGRICTFPVDGAGLVHTFWDLGSPLNTVVWYVQFVGREIRVLDVDMSTDEAPIDLTPTERVARIKAKGYPLGNHYLPHDAALTERSGRTFQTELASLGLGNIKIIPRTVDVWIGINHLRQIFPRMAFRLPACELGIDALTNYHTRSESGTGRASDDPVHDWSSHASDALRMMAEADMHGMLDAGGYKPRSSLVVKRGGESSRHVDPVDAYFEPQRRRLVVKRR